MATTYRAIGGIGRGAPIRSDSRITPGMTNDVSNFGAGNGSSNVGGGNQKLGANQGGTGGGDQSSGSNRADMSRRPDSGKKTELVHPAQKVTELVRPSLKVNDVFTGTVIQANSPMRFWITTGRDSGFNRLPDAMWDYAKSVPGGFVPLKNPSFNASCLILKDATGDQFPLYCRAIVTKLDGEMCDLWLVDYAETKKAQPVGGLLEVPPAFAVLPWQAIKCQLVDANEFHNNFGGDEKKNNAFIAGISHQEVTATVRGFDGVVTIVDGRVGNDKRDLYGICTNIAAGDLNAFGSRESM